MGVGWGGVGCGGGVGWGGGGCTQFVHGRRRTTIDRRIPTMPGRSTSGFLPTRQTLLAPRAERREVFGESQER